MRYLIVTIVICVGVCQWIASAVLYGRTAPLELCDSARRVQSIVAHRGASKERPECTLLAIHRAIEMGATAVEMDVRMNYEGHLFLLHDATLDRTTNGRGPATERSLAELKSLDAGSWFSKTYANARIPTLREAIEVCRGQCDLLLDLKGRGNRFSQAVANEVILHGDVTRTIIGVRSVQQARTLREQLPEARQLGLIPNVSSIESFANADVEMIRLRADWLNSDATLARRIRHFQKQLHLNGDVGTFEEIKPLLAHLPDSISANDPGQLVRTLKALSAGAIRP